VFGWTGLTYSGSTHSILYTDSRLPPNWALGDLHAYHIPAAIFSNFIVFRLGIATRFLCLHSFFVLWDGSVVPRVQAAVAFFTSGAAADVTLGLFVLLW